MDFLGVRNVFLSFGMSVFVAHEDLRLTELSLVQNISLNMTTGARQLSPEVPNAPPDGLIIFHHRFLTCTDDN